MLLRALGINKENAWPWAAFCEEVSIRRGLLGGTISWETHGGFSGYPCPLGGKNWDRMAERGIVVPSEHQLKAN